jgi:hypothetical protein
MKYIVTKDYSEYYSHNLKGDLKESSTIKVGEIYNSLDGDDSPYKSISQFLSENEIVLEHEKYGWIIVPRDCVEEVRVNKLKQL